MTPAPAESRERLAQLRRGEAFETCCAANGANKDAADAILAAFGVKRGESPVAEGQKVILQYDDAEPGKPGDDRARLDLRRRATQNRRSRSTTIGAYVPVTLPRAAAQHNNADGRQRRRQPLRKLLPDGAEARPVETDHQRNGARFRQRRRLPTFDPARRFPSPPSSPSPMKSTRIRNCVRFDDGARSGVQILPVPDAGRRLVW